MTERVWRIPPMLRQHEEREEPAAPEPIAPKAPKEPEVPKPAPPEKEAPKAHPALVLDVSPEEVRPGVLVHVSCVNVSAGVGVGVLVIEAPHHRWEQYARDAANGFTVPLAVAGTYRLALRQPDDKERWSEQARLTVEVVEGAV